MNAAPSLADQLHDAEQELQLRIRLSVEDDVTCDVDPQAELVAAIERRIGEKVGALHTLRTAWSEYRAALQTHDRITSREAAVVSATRSARACGATDDELLSTVFPRSQS